MNTEASFLIPDEHDLRASAQRARDRRALLTVGLLLACTATLAYAALAIATG